MTSRVTSECNVSETKGFTQNTNKDTAPACVVSEEQVSTSPPETQSSRLSTHQLILLVADVDKIIDQVGRQQSVIFSVFAFTIH